MKTKTWYDSDLIEAVQSSESYISVLSKLGIRPGGASYKSIKSHIQRLNLDTSHFKPYVLPTNAKKLTQESVCIENSPTEGSSLRRFIIKNKLVEYKCVHCQNNGEYNKKPLSLQLDHVNGNNRDNRLFNLRFLCPNCHSQTSTYSRIKKERVAVSREPNTVCDGCEGKYWSEPSDVKSKRQRGYKVYCSRNCYNRSRTGISTGPLTIREHGTDSKYKTDRCRCGLCRSAHALKARTRRSVSHFRGSDETPEDGRSRRAD